MDGRMNRSGQSSLVWVVMAVMLAIAGCQGGAQEASEGCEGSVESIGERNRRYERRGLRRVAGARGVGRDTGGDWGGAVPVGRLGVRVEGEVPPPGVGGVECGD